MRNEDKINELKALGKTPDMEDVFDTLEKIGDLKVNYDEILRDDPDYAGGANHLSLNQYREEYKRRMENHCGNREGAMIQLKKMVKDPPTDVRAYYDIAETSGAFEESYKYFKDKEFSDFVMETLREDFKDPEIVDIIKGELKRAEEELKHSKQMRDLLKEYEAHEEEIGFDLNAVKRTLDPAVIHTAVLRVMTEQGVPGWAKRFYIKGKLMELVKMYCR